MATAAAPAPASDPREGVAPWLRGLGFAQLDGGWFSRTGCRVHVTGPKVNIFAGSNGQPWSARTEDAPRQVLAALLSHAPAGDQS
jgi:hypothetical protein